MRRVFFLFLVLMISGASTRASDFIQPFPPFGTQPDQLVVSQDGKNGLLAAWVTSDEESTWVGVQRVTFRGAPHWGRQGVRLNVSKYAKKDVCIVPDHQGGVVLLWREENPTMGHLWLQQISEQGASRWPDAGLAVASGTALGATAVDVDLQGNIAVAWEDRSGSASSVRWQRIDENGTERFPAGGQPVAPGNSARAGPVVVSDRMQGFVVAWQEAGEGDSRSLMAQYVDASLKPVWDVHGMVVTNRGTQQQIQDLIWRKDNTLVVIWRESHPMGLDWEAQRMDASGRRLWGEDGIYLAEEANGQTNAFFTANAEGPLTGGWEDVRTDPAQVYVQQWDKRGLPILGSGMAVVKKRVGEQRDPLIIPSGREDFVLWRDSYDHPWDLYGQRLKDSSLQWDSGVRLGPIGETIGRLQGVSDDYGGFIVLWPEWVPPASWQINILRIDGSGHLIW